jgi:glycosyltransferase involved in cell wall biosynthesis
LEPLISIIIPTFNRKALLSETLQSIKDQTYRNWECIIIDDGSTDNTQELVWKYIYADPRFRYYRKPKDKPKGPSASRNYGFEKSDGQYINWFDSDDLMVATKLETDLKDILSGYYDFTISQSLFFGETVNHKKSFWNNKLFSSDPINDFILKKIGWSVNTPLWKKESLLKYKLSFEEALFTSDDYFFHIQALSKHLKPHINEEVLVRLRVHSERLENFKVKSPFKLKVGYTLLKNNRKGINQESINYLLAQSLRQLSNLFKNRKYFFGMYYSCKFLFLESGYGYKKKLLKLVLFGTFYKLVGRGYKLLDIKFKDD